MKFKHFAPLFASILAIMLIGCVFTTPQNAQGAPADSQTAQHAGNQANAQAYSQAKTPDAQTDSQTGTKPNSQAGLPNAPNDSQASPGSYATVQPHTKNEEMMLGFNQDRYQKFFNPQEECVAACKYAVRNNISLRNGPCLLNPMPQHKDWVCDVAHKPRQAVDNDQENQCSAFRKGISSRFVEVGQECEVIDVY